MALNYYTIGRALGARMLPVAGGGFGGFRFNAARAAILGAIPVQEPKRNLTIEDDRLIAKAFEDTRNGVSVETVMWDADLSKRFHDAIRRAGLNARAADINRRLINVRKHPDQYEKHGIKLSETTVQNPQPSIVPKYAHVIEFALVKMRFLHAASIDDILIDPYLAEEYEGFAHKAAPEATSIQLRLGALYLRKTRHFAKADAALIQMDTRPVQRAAHTIGTLGDINVGSIPSGEGLLEVTERDSYLYIARNADLRAAVSQMAGGQAFAMLANHFWQPKLDEISLRILPGRTFEDVSIAKWQLRLIQEKSPVFNLPVLAKAAA